MMKRQKVEANLALKFSAEFLNLNAPLGSMTQIRDGQLSHLSKLIALPNLN